MKDFLRTVTVTDADGRPQDGAFVVIESVVIEESAKPFPEFCMVTDQDGKLQVSLPKGTYRLCATLGDGVMARADIEDTDENIVTSVLIGLDTTKAGEA